MCWHLVNKSNGSVDRAPSPREYRRTKGPNDGTGDARASWPSRRPHPRDASEDDNRPGGGVPTCPAIGAVSALVRGAGGSGSVRATPDPQRALAGGRNSPAYPRQVVRSPLTRAGGAKGIAAPGIRPRTYPTSPSLRKTRSPPCVVAPNRRRQAAANAALRADTCPRPQRRTRGGAYAGELL